MAGLLSRDSRRWGIFRALAFRRLLCIGAANSRGLRRCSATQIYGCRTCSGCGGRPRAVGGCDRGSTTGVKRDGKAARGGISRINRGVFWWRIGCDGCWPAQGARALKRGHGANSWEDEEVVLTVRANPWCLDRDVLMDSRRGAAPHLPLLVRGSGLPAPLCTPCSS